METKKFTKEELAAWAKAHKKEIALAAIEGVAGGILTVFGVNHKLNQVLVGEFSQEMIEYVNSVVRENGAAPIMNLSGKALGKYLIKHCPNSLINGYINISGPN